MANEIFKEIKTKIALKTLSYTEWDAIKDTYKPLKGEVCVCTIPEGNAAATTAPTVLFKVGDGTNFFGALKWASALAADVYDWAKKTEVDFITWVNTVVEHPAAPDLTPYLVKENITTGGANGTLAVRGEDVAVKGLSSAAYVTVESLNATAKDYADAVEAKLPTSADYGVLEVKGDEASGVVVDNTNAQRPIVKIAANTYDAHGAAAEVQGNLTNYENAHASDYTNAKIDELVQDAKEYADSNDANTEYHVEYDSTNKKIKLVAGADASKMEIDATDFIKDGMINSVELVQEDGEGNKGQYLKLTWNDDGNDVTYVPVGELVDVYTAAANATEVQVAISNTNEVSATLVNGGISTAKIANDAVTADKLADAINTDIAKGVAAKAITDTIGDLAGKDKIIEDDIDGTIGVAKITNFATEVAAVKVTNAANADNATNAVNAGNADTLDNHDSTYFATAESVTELNNSLHTIAKTGSIYDVAEGSNTATDKDGNEVRYIILDCNW